MKRCSSNYYFARKKTVVRQSLLFYLLFLVTQTVIKNACKVVNMVYINISTLLSNVISDDRCETIKL